MQSEVTPSLKYFFRDISRSPTNFIDIEDDFLRPGYHTRTSDTLTMSSRGKTVMPSSASMFTAQEGGSGSAWALDMPLGSVPGLARPSNEHHGSIPDLSKSPGNLEAVPDLGSLPNLAAGPGGAASASKAIPPSSQESSRGQPRRDLGKVPGLTVPYPEDSGVLSGEYNQPGHEGDVRNVGDGMPDLAYYVDSASKGSSSSEIEEALQKLTPQDIERRRRAFNLQPNRYSFDLGSDGFDSPGSLLGKPGFNFLPYGVRTPESFMSTGSRDFHSGSSGYAAGWKLPDKLRIVKPLEGSLTLHQWQRLARPSLEGIFEERRGVAVKGAGRVHLGGGHAQSYKHGIWVDANEQLSDLEEDNNEDEADIAMRLKAGASKLQETVTDTATRILSGSRHLTDTTSMYGHGSRMSTSLFSSRQSSRR